jgi:hypothetical protein
MRSAVAGVNRGVGLVILISDERIKIFGKRLGGIILRELKPSYLTGQEVTIKV